jgi:hypothetical protein
MANKSSKKAKTRAGKGASRSRAISVPETGPLTLEEAQALVRAGSPALRRRRAPRAEPAPEPVGLAREEVRKRYETEHARRVDEYAATVRLLKKRGVRGLTAAAATEGGRRRAPGAAAGGLPIQILAEGDSWFDYPAFFFRGGIIPRLEKLLGVPILNLAKAGDEVRYMLGVEQRKGLTRRLTHGGPAGGPWDVLLFSGGGNDIVDNPMALWIRDYDASIPLPDHIHGPRFDAALALVRAGYEDLIDLRDRLSPTTHLVLHAYDYAIPDGRGICHLGPWLRPTFKLRKFPSNNASFVVVQAMLERFAAVLGALAASHPGVTFLNGQGTLSPVKSSWHNELHPSDKGFDTFARAFQAALSGLFPGRVL